LASERLLAEQKSEEAISAAEKAVALDASDADGYQALSLALVYNGRPDEGFRFLEAKRRIEPKWSRWDHVIAGLAHFSLNKFEEAAAILESIDKDSESRGYWDVYADSTGLKLLIPTYGHLGRNVQASEAIDKIRPLLKVADEGEYTNLLNVTSFPFRDFEDTRRILEGARKVRVSDLPFGFDSKSQDRLDGSAIRALLFGHEIQGQRVETGDLYIRKTAADGATSVRVGTGLADDGAFSRIEGDTVCTFYPVLGYRICAAVVRNPSGTAADKNEYYLLLPGRHFTFSVVN